LDVMNAYAFEFKELELPPHSALEGMKAWVCDLDSFHFLIVYDQASDDGMGYTASYKTYETRNQPAVVLPGKWAIKDDAERACAKEWLRLNIGRAVNDLMKAP